MNRTAALTLFALAFLLASLSSLAAQDPGSQSRMPDTLFRTDRSHPVWVSSTAAASETQGIQWNLFDEYSQRDLHREADQIEAEQARRGGLAKSLRPAHAKAPYLDEDLCVISTVRFDHSDDAKPRGSLADLYRYAVAVVSGEVVGIEQGFLYGLPASLIKVALESVHAGERELGEPDYLYVAYPYAVFALDGKVFCRKDPRYDYRPLVGDRLLLFPASLPVDPEGSLLVIEPEEIFAQKTPETFFVPQRLANDPDLEGIDGLDALRSSLLPAGSADTRTKGDQ